MGLGRLKDGLAPTPPMGWNSWNRFNTRVDETLIRETAEAIVGSGMRDAGYRYVVIDDGWEAPERDEHGDLVADATRFPSGIGALADRVHELGLRFGIYTDAGTATCAGFVGSLGYEFRDARRFASWGVDYVKVDWCNTSGLGARSIYSKWSQAFLAAGRPMVLSVCEWGRDHPWEWADRSDTCGARAGTSRTHGRACARSSTASATSRATRGPITGTTQTCSRSGTAG